MKKLILSVLFIATSIASFNVFADSSVPIRSKSYSCDQLRGLIQENQKIAIKGLFGSTPAYSGTRSCGYRTYAVPGNWRTSDKFFCRAGFICKYYHDDDDN